MMYQSSFAVATRGRGTYEVTDAVQAAVRASTTREGLCTVFVHHTSASLIITENADPVVQRDLDAFLARCADGTRCPAVDEGPRPARSCLGANADLARIPIASVRCDSQWQHLRVGAPQRTAHPPSQRDRARVRSPFTRATTLAAAAACSSLGNARRRSGSASMSKDCVRRSRAAPPRAP